MKLIAQVKLQPTKEQADALKKTMLAANNAANFLSALAWTDKTFRQYDLHKIGYYPVREQFELSAQMTVRIISKVADAYKLDKKTQRTFRPYGSIAYDDRIMSWKVNKRTVSLWTLGGRVNLPFVAGSKQLAMLANRQGEADLVFRGGEFFLYQTCNVDEDPMIDPDGWLGVDMGVVNIASDSDGDIHTSEEIEAVRKRQQALRSALQSRGSLSAKRHLRKLSRKQRRFQKNTNHVLSKRIVAKAARTKRGIALEELTGIRTRTRVKGKEQRAKHGNWSFAQLREFLTYKAKLAGVPVSLVDPRYTSQQCFACGHIEKGNRKSQSEFLCRACGHIDHADTNAALNISRAAVNRPIVSTVSEPPR